MTITRTGLVGAALVFALAGCSDSGGDEPQSPDPSRTPSGTGASSGPPEIEGGVAAVESLSDFECGPDEGGTWSASGRITNDDAKPEDFRVTIAVVPSSGGRGKARELTLAAVPAGESQKFAADKLPIVYGEDPTCSVQVARLDA